MNERHRELTAGLRKRCEDNLDELAMTRAAETGEDFYEAYAKACETPLGRRMLNAHEEVCRIQTA